MRKFGQELTCCNLVSVDEPLNYHGRITDRSNLCFKVGSFSFGDGHILEWGHEGRGRVLGNIFFLALLLGLTLNMLQVDHLRLSLLPASYGSVMCTIKFLTI